MRLTPAYLTAVATFYDMFSTTPKGSHDVYVCTNISCSLRGADAIYDEMLSAAGDDPDFHVTSFECLGACDIAPMASVDGEYVGPLDEARTARGSSTDVKAGREVLPDKQLKKRPKAETLLEVMSLLYENIDDPGLATLDGYSKRGGYEMLRKALSMDPQDVLQEMLDSGVRGRGGAGFAMGKKMSFIPKGAMDKYLVCNADESEPGTFKDRELMQKNPHLLIEGMIIGAYAIGANKSFIFIRGEYSHQADVLDAAVAEAREAGYLGENILGSDAHDRPRRAPRRRRLHLRRGDGAARRARGPARQPAPEAAVPGRAGPLPGPDADQQRRDADERAGHPADGRRQVRRDRHADLDRHQGRLGQRLRPAAGQLRDRARRPLARDHLRPRRRPARGAHRQGVVPGRLERAGAHRLRRAPRPAVRLRHARQGRLDARLRRDHRDRRLDLDRRRRAARRRSSTATSRAASARRAARARTGP